VNKPAEILDNDIEGIQSIGQAVAPVVEKAGQAIGKRPDYAWWSAALKDPSAIGDTLLIHDGHPQDGFYVMRSRKRWKKGVPFHTVPQVVAIWTEDGKKLAATGTGDECRLVSADEIWTWVADAPVSEAFYRAIERGEPWPPEYQPKGTVGLPMIVDGEFHERAL